MGEMCGQRTWKLVSLKTFTNNVKTKFLYVFLNYVYLLIWFLNSSGGVPIAATIPLFPASMESSRVGAEGHSGEFCGLPGRTQSSSCLHGA